MVVEAVSSCDDLPSTTMTTQAAIYCRISDDREGAGLGVERQEKDCQALAERNGWNVNHVYVDNDVSAYDRKRKRQAWAGMLEALARGEHQAVIAWHPDRLYRQMRDLLALIELCDRDRVKVVTVTAGDVDLSTATGRAVAKTVAAWNEHESEHKAERNRAKALELANAGKLGNGGPRPFGYQPDRISIEPAEAAILQQCYSDVLAGRGLRTIVRDLAEQGVTTSTCGRWTVQGLKFTLLRARNIGWREHHGRLAAPAVWEPIIDAETWHQVKAILTDPGRLNMGQAQYVRRYLLTGFLRCGRCGRQLSPNRSTKQDVQRFACRRDPGEERCGGISIVYAPAEEAVVALILARLVHDVDLQPDVPDDPTRQLRDRIGVEEARLTALADAFADESGDVLEFRRAGQRIRGRITDLRAQIAQAAVAQRLTDPVEIRGEWPNYDLLQRRAVLDQLIERIDVAPAVRGRNTFDPDRLTVIWR